MKIQITVKVSGDIALTLHDPRLPTSEPLEELLKMLEDLGVSLDPVHPGARDPFLVPYFTIEVPDTQTAERVMTQIRRSKAIEATYVKPPDEMP